MKITRITKKGVLVLVIFQFFILYVIRKIPPGTYTNIKRICSSNEHLVTGAYLEKNDINFITERAKEAGKTKESYIEDTKEPKLIKDCHWNRNKQVSCKKLFQGDPTEFIKASRYNYTKSSIKCSLGHLLRNCSIFLMAHEYITKVSDLSQEELHYPLAFAIKMHKSPEQAEQLIRSIYRPHNVYCLYVDKKAEFALFFRIKQLSKCLENIVVVEDRVDIVYGTSAHIVAERQCMKRLLLTKVRWKYYINLTGQEFPLRTNLEIVKILQSLNGANDIESYIFPATLSERVAIKWYVKNNTLISNNESKKQFGHNIQLRKGSAYGLFRREFIEFIQVNPLANEFIDWLNDTSAPEETVWSTLNAFSGAPGGYTLQTKHSSSTFLSRAIIWHWDMVKCNGKWIRSVCIFGVRDLPWLMTKPQLFLNKFDRDFDPLAIDCLEDLLRNRTKSEANGEENLNWFYYRNLPHAKYYTNLTANSPSI